MKLILKNTAIEFRHYEFEPKNYGLEAFSVNKILLYSGDTVYEGELSGYASTPMLPMLGATSIAFCVIGGKLSCCSYVYYDENGNVISHVETNAGNNGNNFAYTDNNIPANACYVRACCLLSGTTAPYVNIS